MQLYLALSNTIVSMALIREEEGAFALVITSRKLHHYFQAHPIILMTDQPIRKKMNKIDVVGRLVQWAIKLG